MLNVGIIGCGNAGNQVCALSARLYPDIPVIAINCSENDLRTLPQNIHGVLIGDGRGAGKNREEAKEFLEKSIMDFVTDQYVREFLSKLDIVFIVSSTGGGTGSGISILLTNVIRAVCADAENPVFPIPVGILPTLNEALSTQANSLSYLTELYDFTDNPTYMLYDNDKFSKLSTVEMMKSINSAIVEDINVLRGFYNSSTTYNSIDERDAMTIITTPGRLMVASVYDLKEKDCDDENGVEDRLIQEIKKNGHAEVQIDGIVNRTGVIANVSESLMKSFDTHVPKIQKMIGSPVEEFEHITVNSERKLPNNIFYIASGLTPINDRIAKIKDRIEEIMEAQKKKQDEMELDKDMLSVVQSKRVYRKPTASTSTNNQVDLSSIFNKFKNK